MKRKMKVEEIVVVIIILLIALWFLCGPRMSEYETTEYIRELEHKHLMQDIKAGKYSHLGVVNENVR